MSITERIRLVANQERNLQAFADKIGQKEPSIRNMLSRGGNPSFNYLLSIAEAYPDLNTRWLITGEGNMWLEEITKFDKEKTMELERAKEELKYKKRIIESLERNISVLEEHIDLMKKIEEMKKDKNNKNKKSA